jgi:hypothetical protein
MVTKRRFVGRKSRIVKFRKQNKTKLRKTVKLTKTKSKRPNKKRKYNTKRRFRLKGGADDVCPICQDDFKEGDETITTSCGHRFHKNELIQWFHHIRHGPYRCPMDRIDISQEMAQYMPQNDNHSDSDSDGDSDSSTELSLQADIVTLENFMGETATLLHNMPYLRLPETPYLDGVNLPISVEGGPKEKIKNMLICLFANDHYFYDNLNFLNGCNIMESVDHDDEEGINRLKIALITVMMNLVNDNRNYRDDQLRQLIKNYLEICAADVLFIYINPPPNINI